VRNPFYDTSAAANLAVQCSVETTSTVMKTISRLGTAAFAATLYFSGAPAPADEIITERAKPAAPVVVAPAPAPVVEERKTTTTPEPRSLTDAEKERLEKERAFLERARAAKKDFEHDIREMARFAAEEDE